MAIGPLQKRRRSTFESSLEDRTGDHTLIFFLKDHEISGLDQLDRPVVRCSAAEVNDNRFTFTRL